MRENLLLSIVKKQTKSHFNSEDDILKFWSLTAQKLEIKKNICSLFAFLLSFLVVLLNLFAFSFLITIIVMIVNKINDPNFDTSDAHAVKIILLIAWSAILSIGVIISSFILNNLKKRNKASIYKSICSELNYLYLMQKKSLTPIDVDLEIKKILGKTRLVRKEKLSISLKKFLSEDKLR